MNSILSIQQLHNYVLSGGDAFTNLTGSFEKDVTYSITGYNTYFFFNPTAPTNTSSSDSTGTFTFNFAADTTIYYLIFGGGGSGGGGNEGGGGGGSGDLIVGSMVVTPGLKNCSYTIGRGGRSIGYIAGGPYTSDGANGYGYRGGNTVLTIDANTFTANGGGPGGPSQANNGASGFVNGGGSGTRIGSTPGYSGATGTKKNGGGTPNNIANCGGGGGASPFENGPTASNSAGARGGRGMISTNLSAPFNSFTSTKYFCEGGGGASMIRGTASTAPFYGIGGRGCFNAANPATSGAANTGSGGGAILYGDGTYSGMGSHGGIIIAYAS